MNRVNFYTCLITAQFLFGISISNAQIQNESIDTDSTNIITGVAIPFPLDFCNTKWFTISSQYDLINTTFGLLISNGYDERPMIHFEDFTEYLMLKIHGTTDFQNDYSFGASVAYQYPIRYISLVSFDYKNFDYSSIDFLHQDFNIAALKGIRYINAGFRLGFGYQKLNDFQNIGVNTGLQKVLIYRRLFTDISCGYYGDYWTWSAKLQGFIYKDLISVGIKYDRIDTYDFLNLGLNFTFEREKQPLTGWYMP